MIPPKLNVHGVVTHLNTQNAAAFNAARDVLGDLGVTFDLVQLHRSGDLLRVAGRWLSSRRGGRPRSKNLLMELSRRRPPDFVVLKPESVAWYRPAIAALVLLICRARRIALFMNWGNCKWNLTVLEDRTGVIAKYVARAVARDPWVHHLAPTPASLSDARAWAGFENGTVIWNAPMIAKGYDERVAPTEPPTIVNVASVQPRKGTDLFLEVAQRVAEAHSTVRFIWVGGEPTAEMRAELAAAGLEDRVLFVGRAEPPFEFYRHASGVLFTSRSEAFGLTVAEAMAQWRTVFCFSGTGAADAVGDTGIVVPRFDTRRMAAAILEHLHVPAAGRINDAARERYDSHFSPVAYAQRLAAAIAERTVEEGDRRSSDRR